VEHFFSVVRPVQIRALKLRYINRILLPLTDDEINLDKYLKLGPRVPDEDRLTLLNFMNHNMALDVETGHRVKTVLASQDIENNQLPVIFDIEVTDRMPIETLDWAELEEHIGALRGLKNCVFEHTLNDACRERLQ
jgi:uncharacterized protein (TIGR04255 family)